MKNYLKSNAITILSIIVGLCCTALISLDVKHKQNLYKKNLVIKEIKKK